LSAKARHASLAATAASRASAGLVLYIIACVHVMTGIWTGSIGWLLSMRHHEGFVLKNLGFCQTVHSVTLTLEAWIPAVRDRTARDQDIFSLRQTRTNWITASRGRTTHSYRSETVIYTMRLPSLMEAPTSCSSIIRVVLAFSTSIHKAYIISRVYVAYFLFPPSAPASPNELAK
jgi:hypothetical protein